MHFQVNFRFDFRVRPRKQRRCYFDPAYILTMFTNARGSGYHGHHPPVILKTEPLSQIRLIGVIIAMDPFFPYVLK